MQINNIIKFSQLQKKQLSSEGIPPFERLPNLFFVSLQVITIFIFNPPPQKLELQQYHRIHLNSMSNICKLRQRIQQSKKTCLLRKIRFYEYLATYNTSIDFQNSTVQNKAIKSFFPHVNYHSRVNTSASNKPKPTVPIQDAINHTAETDILPYFQTTLSTKSSVKESLQPPNQQQLTNISQLVAKSMTPSTRTHLNPIKTHTARMSSVAKQNHFSTIENQQKINRLRRKSSPKKRTYIGNVYYIKQKVSQQNAKINYRTRKQSIAPWEIDEDYL